MTLEEQIEDLKNQVEATTNKNAELLKELRTAKNKNKELDFETYNKVLEENDTLKGQLSKLTNDLGLKTKDLEKVNGLLSEKDNYLKNLTLENALNENLAKIKVKDEYKEAVKALFKQSAKVEDNNVIINDKSINDFVSEWANDAGKPFISAPQNSGSGANGGQTLHSASNLKRSAMTHAEKGEYIKANGQDAYLKLPN